MTDSTVYMGIEVTAGARPLTLAVLNGRLDVLKVETLKLEELIEVILEYPSSVCGIDAPSGVNKELLAEPDYRENLGLDPRKKTYNRYRVCEYELRRRRISIYSTPADKEKASKWMLTGWELYDRLRGEGYSSYPAESSRRLFEVHPHAAFTVLVKKRPYSKNSMEGLLQRQLVLYESGLDIHDPMQALEEWTRHHMLTGKLRMEGIYSHVELDALCAAYTAFVLDKNPQKITAVGDSGEGQIILPTAELLDRYN